MKTILVVDDEYAVVDALTSLLSDEGYEVLAASNGEEGLARLAEQRPDLVLLDIMMPVLDGREMLRTMRTNQEYRTIPVVGMSAGSEPLADEGWTAFLHKPFDLDDLLKTVAGILGPGR